MKTMYPAQVNSPGTELEVAIDAEQDVVLVVDGSVLPDGPNLLTIGTDEAAETILYTGKNGNELTGITRGFQGTAHSWAPGTKVARYFTAYDHDVTINNISELSTGLKELSDAARDRLDILQRKDVVLNTGLQILSAQRCAAFSLSGIKGRTLVNLLGRRGSFESVAMWGAYATKSPLTVSNNEITFVGDGTAKNPQIINKGSLGPTPKLGEKLFIRAKGMVKEDCLSLSIYLYSSVLKTIFGQHSINNPTKNKKYELYKSFTVTQELLDNWSNTTFRLATTYDSMEGAANKISVYSQAALYRVSADDLTLSDDQLAAKYLHVNSIQPVRDPYSIRYGENLVPPFYEWVISDDALILHPYHLSLTPTGEYKGTYISVPCLPETTYTLQGAVSGNGKLYADVRDTSEGHTYHLTSGGFVTFTTSKNSAGIDIIVTNDTTIAGAMEFKDISLVLGSTPKPFKPREDSMLALQTELYADPLIGETADEVFEKDGQYFKLAKWSGAFRIGIDALTTHDYALSGTGTINAGYKRVRVRGLPKTPINEVTSFLTKYDGKVIPTSFDWTSAVEQHSVKNDSGNYVLILVNNADSGWGESYTPTADEIKAYFMGWKMCNYNDTTIYNGIGTKCWGKITEPNNYHGSLGWANPVTILPTTPAGADSGGRMYTPYQLVYQLATPTVEPVISEGMLTLNEGDNQIEVGTGLVLREKVNPKTSGDTGIYVINDMYLPGSQLINKVEKFLAVYKNAYLDKWEFRSNNAYGNERRVKTVGYDPSATYSVTYLMLDKSPIVPFNGSYATNEKAMLQALTDAVQQNATGVSVLMNKKADKDSPGWITPTLLSGWVNFGMGTSIVAYTKDALGFVHVKGRVKSGTIGSVPVFILPVGYRPNEALVIPGRGWHNNQIIVCSISISTDGTVIVVDGTNNEVAMDGITFLAER